MKVRAAAARPLAQARHPVSSIPAMRLAWLSGSAPCARSFCSPLLLLCRKGLCPGRRPACSRAARSRRARRFAAAPCPALWCQTPAAPPRFGQLHPPKLVSAGGCTHPCPVGNPCQTSTNLQPWQAVPTMGIGGINGALDFGPLASGVGGEGTGLVRCCHACRALHAHRTQRCKPSAAADGVFRAGYAAYRLPLPFPGAGRQRAVAAGRPPCYPRRHWLCWRGEYQDDDEDFFDTYDSRREDREILAQPRLVDTAVR